MYEKVDYTSNNLTIPDSFLTSAPAEPLVAKHIDWASSALPQNKGKVAFVVDDVLSREECAELIALAEASVPVEGGASPWKPALIDMGAGLAASLPNYRKSDRIIWDQQVVVSRIGERILQAEGVREQLASLPEDLKEGVWKIWGFNERMRFLKYSEGHFFKPHKDAMYAYEKDGTRFETGYTIQLYLNDSAETDPASELVGGATSFLSHNRASRVDVNPRAGSALIFQQAGLLHEGAEVKAGVKYTMRAEIVYEHTGPKVEKKAATKGWWE